MLALRSPSLSSRADRGSSRFAIVAVVGMAHVTVVRGILGLRDELIAEFEEVKDLSVRWRIVSIGVVGPDDAVAFHGLAEPREVRPGIGLAVAAFLVK